MSRKQNNLFGPIVLVFVILVGLYASNPTTKHFKNVMKEQKSLKLDIAAQLPISRVDYKLFSRFDIKYGFGKTTCYGAAGYLFYCPKK